MQEQKNKRRIALLVDYDNFNQDEYFNVLFDELDEMGDVIIGRVYFSNEAGKNLSNKFKNLKLDPIYQLRFSTGKNAVDIRMSIEAIELLNKEYINAFCLATHDSDFTPLVIKLKENNKYVIGAGRDNVSLHFKDACDQFINVEQIANAKKSLKDSVNGIDEFNKSLPIRINSLVNLIDEIIEQNKEEDGTGYLSRVTEQLYLKNKEFNPKNYGATNSKILPFFQKQLNDYYEMISENKTWKIKTKPRLKKENNKKNNRENKKELAIKIVNDFYNTNEPANIQKLQIELRKQIKNFTLKNVGHNTYKNFFKEIGYEIIGNNYKKIK